MSVSKFKAKGACKPSSTLRWEAGGTASMSVFFFSLQTEPGSHFLLLPVFIKINSCSVLRKGTISIFSLGKKENQHSFLNHVSYLNVRSNNKVYFSTLRFLQGHAGSLSSASVLFRQIHPAHISLDVLQFLWKSSIFLI